MNDEPLLKFERVELTPRWGEAVETFPGSMITQTPPWLDFLASTQGGEPVCAVLRCKGKTVGYFTGFLIRKFGVKVLGSPFPGWTTTYMGMVLSPEISRRAAVQALAKFAFVDLHCIHLEMMDRQITLEDLEGITTHYRLERSYEVDLSAREDEILKRMSRGCSGCIRKAIKSGVVVEEAHDAEFAAEFCAQQQDVYARQGLVPSYDLKRVQELIRCLQPTGRLLLIRARNPQGECIATGIFIGISSDRAYFWGMSSWREHLSLRPNDMLFWHAITYWKKRGMRFLDMGGGGDYKKKFGGGEIAVPWFQISRYPIIMQLRDTAQKAVALRQKMLGRWKTGVPPRDQESPETRTTA